MADSGGARVVLGVSGGIAAYKAALLLRLLTEGGCDVTVIPTAAALRFVGEPTWSALSGHPVTDQVWDDVHEVRHVRLGQQAQLVVVAPATADLLARAAHGLADDLLTNTLLTTRAPVLFVPAMHTEMWQHPATQANVAILRERGAHVMEPVSGRLTGIDSGPGRLPEPDDIHAECLRLLSETVGGPVGSASRSDGTDLPVTSGSGQLLAGLRIAVSAGGTREPLDPVRFLGNRSSGKQGYALAEVAAQWGASVELISANVALPAPAGATITRVETALDLREAMREVASRVDVVVMAAAVADFRPKRYAAAKIKKARPGLEPDPTIELVRNPDILAELVAARGVAKRPLIVGFAAETGDDTGDVLHHARAKLQFKGCDLLVANEVGVDLTFGKDLTTVHILSRDTDEVVQAGPGSKHEAAAAIWRAVHTRLGLGTSQGD